MRIRDRGIRVVTPTEPLQIASIPASIDNEADWGELSQEIAAELGMASEITPATIAAMLAGAVPLLFAADASNDMGSLRGTFADPVIAQCQRNAGGLHGGQPTSVRAHLVGAHLVDGHPTLRAHLLVELHEASNGQSASNQFWDLQLAAQATVAQSSCPNCGAPLATGELMCSHCNADVRTVVAVPMIVSRLEIY
jgi:hypothetical protein